MELQTLVEEDELMEQPTLEQETQYSSSLDHPMQWEDHMTSATPTLLDNQPLLTHNNKEALSRNHVHDSFMSDTSTSNRFSVFNVSSQCCVLLYVMTVCVCVCVCVCV